MGEPWPWFDGNVMEKTDACLFIRGERGGPHVFVLPSLFDKRIWANLKWGDRLCYRAGLSEKNGLEPRWQAICFVEQLRYGECGDTWSID